MKFLIATNNKHKISEFKALLSSHILIFPSTELKFVESGNSYEENAVIKLKELLKCSNATDADCFFSDDSGLEIKFLDGKPGLYSSRFLEGLSQVEKNKKIIEMMKSTQDRTAVFKTFLSFCKRGGEIMTVSATLAGTIFETIDGAQGFGYDPIFIPDGFDKTMARLGVDTKNKISHRSQAVKKMLDILCV